MGGRADACLHGDHGCDANADCLPKTLGGHNCVCRDGFVGPGKVCNAADPIIVRMPMPCLVQPFK